MLCSVTRINNRGFGFIHDGSVDTLFTFLQFPGFQFAGGATGNQQRRNVEACLFCFATDTHAGVGAQVTLPAVPGGPTAQDLLNLAAAGSTGLVAKGLVGGEQRGYYLTGGTFQSDRAAESLSSAALLALASTGAEITLTAVPVGSEIRIGADRDEDGYLAAGATAAFKREELCGGPRSYAEGRGGGAVRAGLDSLPV